MSDSGMVGVLAGRVRSIFSVLSYVCVCFFVFVYLHWKEMNHIQSFCILANAFDVIPINLNWPSAYNKWSIFVDVFKYIYAPIDNLSITDRISHFYHPLPIHRKSDLCNFIYHQLLETLNSKKIHPNYD